MGTVRAHSVLAARSIRIALAAVVIGAVVAAAIVAALGGFKDAGAVDRTFIGSDQHPEQRDDFATAKRGDCLTWPDVNSNDRSRVACASPHRFEVAGAIDTKTLPPEQAGWFDKKADRPTPEQLTQLRDQACPAMVNQYLGKTLDQQYGRFVVGLLYPNEAEWNADVRDVYCGVQLRGENPGLFTGNVADLDQSQQWPAGTCLGIDPTTKQATEPVKDCTEPHALEVTAQVDLGVKFGGANAPWPPEAAQQDYLKQTCPGLTDTYLGDRDRLKQTTLNVQWTTIPEPTWATGARKVSCYVALPDGKGFATLVNSAKGLLLINGRVPVPPSTAPPGRELNPAVPMPPGVTSNPMHTQAPLPG